MKCKLWLLLNSLVQFFFLSEIVVVLGFVFVLWHYLRKSLGFSLRVLLGILALTQENTAST